MRQRTTAVAVLCGTVLVAGGLAGCGGGSAASGSSPAASRSAAAATRFTDPDKAYTMTVGSTWRTAAPPGKGIEAWAVAEPEDGFAANVNVLTQEAPGLDLQGYLDASLANMGSAKVVAKGLTSEGGHRLGLLEYTATMPSGGKNRALHFLATFDVAGGRAVVATLTAEESRFARLRPAVEPYLRSLKAT